MILAIGLLLFLLGDRIAIARMEYEKANGRYLNKKFAGSVMVLVGFVLMLVGMLKLLWECLP